MALTDTEIAQNMGWHSSPVEASLTSAIEAAAVAPLLERIAALEAQIEHLTATASANYGRGHADAHSMQVEQAAKPVDVDTLTDKIASMLGGTYHCTRVWNAWNVGTMSQDDFCPVDESDTPREIAEEICSLYKSPPKAAPLTDEQVTVGCETAEYDDGQELEDGFWTGVRWAEMAHGITPAAVEKG